MAATPQEAEKSRVLMADAKARISVYGGPKTLGALARFYKAGGTSLSDPASIAAFLKVCQAMRQETGGRATDVDYLSLILFARGSIPDIAPGKERS